MLALLVVVVGALAVAYAIVVPRLEARLVDAKLDQLERDSRLVAANVPPDLAEAQTFAEEVSNERGARVVIYQVVARGPLLLLIRGDSRVGSSLDVERNAVVRRAVATRRSQRGTLMKKNQRFAEVASPAANRQAVVVLLRDSLVDPLSSVQFVKRRLILAGLIALGVALFLGYAGASMHARRIRRLERAADRIAGGEFDEPVVDRGNDELGQLAGAFERMRARLENLDRARREFIANASHELRTPLFSLGGFLELLSDEDLDPETRAEFLAETRAQVERLTRLATDLLDLSRLDAGQLAVEHGQVDLTIAARTVCEEFRALADSSGHPLSVEGPDEVVAAGDHERVVQIGRILVENALRHTPAGTAVELRPSEDGDVATLAVRDEGPGIAAEDQEHVFERFYRAGGGRASGSGLGLAIARELASRMDGALELASTPGETVLTLSLPSEAPFPRGNGEPSAAREPATTL